MPGCLAELAAPSPKGGNASVSAPQGAAQAPRARRDVRARRGRPFAAGCKRCQSAELTAGARAREPAGARVARARACRVLSCMGNKETCGVVPRGGSVAATHRRGSTSAQAGDLPVEMLHTQKGRGPAPSPAPWEPSTAYGVLPKKGTRPGRSHRGGRGAACTCSADASLAAAAASRGRHHASEAAVRMTARSVTPASSSVSATGPRWSS